MRLTSFGCLLATALLAAPLAAGGDTAFTYDRNGNLTSQTVEGVTTQYLYDVPNRLVEVRRAENILVRFQYDGRDRVIKRIGAQGVRQYVYDGDTPHVIGEYDENGQLVANYTWGNDHLVSINRPGQRALFPHHDGLGSIVALTDTQGNVVARYHYDSWGSPRFPEEFATDPNRYGFTGHRWDEEIGSYKTPARRYDPAIGRFTTQDSYLGSWEDPFSIHRYLYGNANPTRYTDPTGHWSWEGFAEGLKNLPRAIAEPVLWIYDTALVVGAERMGIAPDHFELQSALGRRQQERIEEEQGALVAAAKGAVEAPAAVFSFGTTAVVQGHYEVYKAYHGGQITLEEYDHQLSQMAGGQAGAAALGTAAASVGGRGWMGRAADAAKGGTGVVAEGPHGVILVPIERSRVPNEPMAPSFTRVTGGSRGANASPLGDVPPSIGVSRSAPQAVRLAGSKLEHMNAAIAEQHGYAAALEKGQIGIQGPGKATARGPDYVTFDPRRGDVVVWDSKYRGPTGGSAPSTVPASRLQRWAPEVKAAIEAMPDGPAKAAAQAAFQAGRIRGEVSKWPQ